MPPSYLVLQVLATVARSGPLTAELGPLLCFRRPELQHPWMSQPPRASGYHSWLDPPTKGLQLSWRTAMLQAEAVREVFNGDRSASLPDLACSFLSMRRPKGVGDASFDQRWCSFSSLFQWEHLDVTCVTQTPFFRWLGTYVDSCRQPHHWWCRLSAYRHGRNWSVTKGWASLFGWFFLAPHLLLTRIGRCPLLHAHLWLVEDCPNFSATGLIPIHQWLLLAIV